MTSLITDAVGLLVEVRKHWSDRWEPAPDLQPLRGGIAAENNNQQGSFTFLYRYGATQYPADTVFSDRDPVDYDQWFVRVLHSPHSATDILWLGRFMADPTEVFGNQSGSPDNAAGVQTLIAYDGHTILQKMEFFASTYRVFDETPGEDSANEQIDFVTPFNLRVDSELKGNRSKIKYTIGSSELDCYLFGGELEDVEEEPGTWTALDAVEYLLATRINSTDPDNVPFSLVGQTNILAGIEDTFELPTPFNILEALQTIINRKYAVGFVVLPNDSGNEGFVIKVFGLLADPVTFGSATVPANAATWEIEINSSIEHTKVSVESSGVDRFSSIRIIGARAVICASFERADDMLEPMWDSALEPDYEDEFTGAGPYLPSQYDRARQNDKYRHVYSTFRVPAKQDKFPGFTAGDDGTLDFVQAPPKVQAVVRSTLDWTPMLENMDYSVNPPESLGEVVGLQSFIPPAVYVQDGEDEYLLAESGGIGVEILPNDLGISLRSSVPHYHALDTIVGEFITDIDPTYKATDLVATIAFESDQRLRLYAELDDHVPTNGTKVIEVPAQLWLLAPETVIGVDEDGDLVRSPNEWLVLRNDLATMEQAMAGAIARYTEKRSRLTASAMGISLWQYRLGDIVHVVNDGTPASSIKGPMTSINWEFERGHSSVIKTGYARLNPGELASVVFGIGAPAKPEYVMAPVAKQGK